MGWRYLAYRHLGDGSETLLHADLPLSDVSIIRTLSAAPVITGKIVPEILSLKDTDGRPILDEWATTIYAELDGSIRAGGILTNTTLDNDVLSITVKGFMSYPDGQAWTDSDALFYDADPALVYLFAWNKIQSHPGSNLNLKVDQIKTGFKVGKRAAGNTTPGGASDEPAGFARWKTNDLGKDMNDLLSAGSIEVRETHTWDGDGIAHRLELAYPRRGRKVDYRFVIGENVLDVPKVTPNADLYASEVVIVGAGDGPAAIIGTAATARRDRMRRAISLSRQDLANTQLVQNQASSSLKARSIVHDNIDELIVRDTPYAPLVSLEPGDDILVTGPAGWAGDLSLALRVISIEHKPQSAASAILKVDPIEKAY